MHSKQQEHCCILHSSLAWREEHLDSLVITAGSQSPTSTHLLYKEIALILCLEECQGKFILVDETVLREELGNLSFIVVVCSSTVHVGK